MAAFVSIHIRETENMNVSSEAFGNEGEPRKFAATDLRLDGKIVLQLFFNTIEDVEKMAFEFSTLAQTLRDNHGWTSIKEAENRNV
jgi:hypothetical protein